MGILDCFEVLVHITKPHGITYKNRVVTGTRDDLVWKCDPFHDRNSLFLRSVCLSDGAKRPHAMFQLSVCKVKKPFASSETTR
jgi:hypothetical protein